MIDLSTEEVEALLRVLDDYIPELRLEIHRTEWNRDLRRELEVRESLLAALRTKLAGVREKQQIA